MTWTVSPVMDQSSCAADNDIDHAEFMPILNHISYLEETFLVLPIHYSHGQRCEESSTGVRLRCESPC